MPTHPYAPILVLILVVMGFVGLVLVLSHLVGPRRRGGVKDSTYESGMPVIGDARRRFNVRFYLVAMMFLLFDVEMVLLWPWVLVLHDAAVKGVGIDGQPLAAAAGDPDKTFLMATVAVFFLILVVGYVYDWGKGIFRWT